MKRLGEILLDWGVIAIPELHTGLEACHRKGGRLGTQLLRHGFVDEHALLDALTEQYGVPSVSAPLLRRSAFDVRSLIPPAEARRLQAVPFERTSDHLKVAMTNPRDPAIIEEVMEITGTRIKPYVATEAAILEIVSELNGESTDKAAVTRAERGSHSGRAGDWDGLWNPPRVGPDQLLESPRPVRAQAPRPWVATFPNLTPIERDLSEDADHEIDEQTFRELLTRVEHRDQVGKLLLRYAAGYFGRLCLFAVHRMEVVGWMARGHGVVVDDVQSFSMSLDRPSLFQELGSGEGYHIGGVPKSEENDAIVAVFGDPRPVGALLLPVRIKSRTVAFLLGDNINEETVAVPAEELASAAHAAGLAFETLILKKKIVS
jgi:hypothetical protein